MDVNIFGAYSGIVSAVLIIGGAVYTVVNHRRIRSKCCGHVMEASIDIEHTTPSAVAIAVAPAAPSVVPVVPALSIRKPGVQPAGESSANFIV